MARPLRHFRNWISWIGLVLAVSAVFAFILLFLLDQFSGHRNPYVGILGYAVAPFFLLLGVVIAIIGALLHWRRQRKTAVVTPEAPVITIDFSRARDRRIFAIFGIASVVFLLITAAGSYETYQYTESVQFCGKQCHLPMHPQDITAEHTAHASVECVACHVGPGAAAYFKTKINGVKQLYHTVRNDFDRPIQIGHARPAQAICEQCHWPKKYVGPVVRSYQHYLADEKNTPFAVRLILNVGGGDESNGPKGGIHWHMNIANKIEYIATDDSLMTIPWVRMTDPQGQVHEYRDADFKEDISKFPIHRMDCMDCHSRPAHKVHTPNDAVDLALSTGKLDPATPWVKAKVVTAITKPYSTTPQAEQGIAADLRNDYPDPAQSDRIIKVAQNIYRENFFPEVKTDWRTHPDFVGHKTWNGCFRCHDGKHNTADGSASIKASDCRSCHVIVAQGSGEALNQLDAKGHEFMHIDAEYSDFTCAECHTGAMQK